MSNPQVNTREDVLKYPDIVARAIQKVAPKDQLATRAAVLRFPSAALYRYIEATGVSDYEDTVSELTKEEE